MNIDRTGTRNGFLCRGELPIDFFLAFFIVAQGLTNFETHF
jgi:hypothetical protein